MTSHPHLAGCIEKSASRPVTIASSYGTLRRAPQKNNEHKKDKTGIRQIRTQAEAFNIKQTRENGRVPS